MTASSQERWTISLVLLSLMGTLAWVSGGAAQVKIRPPILLGPKAPLLVKPPRPDLSFKPRVTPQKALPDLIIAQVAGGDAPGFFRVTVKNIGAGKALKQSRLEIALQRGAGRYLQPLGVRVALIPALNPGATYDALIALELPAGVSPDGFRAVIDARNDVAESNENNNIAEGDDRTRR